MRVSPVELITYRGAYHRFDRGPASGSGIRGDKSYMGYVYRQDNAAKKDAFSRTVAWFKKYLQD